jgi:hypothetical protein
MPAPSIHFRRTGTIVYDGVLDGRPVAVKRLLRQFYDLARKEIQVRFGPSICTAACKAHASCASAVPRQAEPAQIALLSCPGLLAAAKTSTLQPRC